MSTIRLGAVSLDCADPAALGAFWAALLGGEIVVERDDIVVVGLDHLLLTAMRVERHIPPTWPDGAVPEQCHVDLAVDDLDEAERRAVELGAALVEPQPERDSHRVLRDPAGHPFCVSLAANFPA